MLAASVTSQKANSECSPLLLCKLLVSGVATVETTQSLPTIMLGVDSNFPQFSMIYLCKDVTFS